MKLHHDCDCTCHGIGHVGHGADTTVQASVAVPPSTGFFVLALSLSLMLCGLISTGVIPLMFW